MDMRLYCSDCAKNTYHSTLFAVMAFKIFTHCTLENNKSVLCHNYSVPHYSYCILYKNNLLKNHHKVAKYSTLLDSTASIVNTTELVQEGTEMVQRKQSAGYIG
jgi:hypothetical protein